MDDFNDWKQRVDELCLRHLACSWHDLCGDMPPLQQAFEDGESPIGFVCWWAEKFDLQWREAGPTVHPAQSR
jgi:hypothetical protein